MTNPTAREALAAGELEGERVGDEAAKTIITILRRAGFEIVPKGAVEAEREACAKLFEEQEEYIHTTELSDRQDIYTGEIESHKATRLKWPNGKVIAAAIRARGKE